MVRGDPRMWITGGSFLFSKLYHFTLLVLLHLDNLNPGGSPGPHFSLDSVSPFVLRICAILSALWNMGAQSRPGPWPRHTSVVFISS